MIGFNLKTPPQQILAFAGTCIHCQNEGIVKYSIPADIGIVLRSGKVSFEACDRCYDAESKGFKPGYQFGLTGPDFGARFDNWLKLRSDEGRSYPK